MGHTVSAGCNAEHYQRIINEFEPVQQAQQQPRFEDGEQPAAAGEGEQPVVQMRGKRGGRNEGADEGDLGLPSSILGASEAASAG